MPEVFHKTVSLPCSDKRLAKHLTSKSAYRLRHPMNNHESPPQRGLSSVLSISRNAQQREDSSNAI